MCLCLNVCFSGNSHKTETLKNRGYNNSVPTVHSNHLSTLDERNTYFLFCGFTHLETAEIQIKSRSFRFCCSIDIYIQTTRLLHKDLMCPFNEKVFGSVCNKEAEVLCCCKECVEAIQQFRDDQDPCISVSNNDDLEIQPLFP